MSRLRNRIGHKGPEILIKGNQPIKNEFEYPRDQVFHRKSERRRVARDIFLVFEEEPKSRAGNKSKKQSRTRPKSKFGHLKVGEINGTSCNNNTRTVQNFNSHNLKNHFAPAIDVPTAKVNPIFLWVKQDDTRIVEVRCEDYDKRNRIRITKTTNGWRAFPHTDPASSRVVKFLPTPLITIKRENICSDHKTIASDVQIKQLPLSQGFIDSILPCSNSANFVQKKQKKERKKRKRDIEYKNHADSGDSVIKDTANLEPSSEIEVPVLIEKDLQIPQTDSNTLVNFLEKKLDRFSVTENLNSFVSSKETYQTEIQELELCPETGLFVSKNVKDMCTKTTTNEFCHLNEIVINLEGCDNANCEIQDDKIEKDLDDETKNLKDLLDDADLLQHCSDNANSGSDLIDSLMKHSCENNLIEDNEPAKDNLLINNQQKNFSDNGQIHMQNEPVTEILSRINNSINASPKCLSFNEAGEIEDVNGELFQSNNFIDTFSKQAIDDINILPLSTKDDLSEIACTVNDKECCKDHAESSPKDLSYKKREEVCPQSESRSQCAVTSTSDVKSPCLSSEHTFEPTSEAIKNIIFEQFLKLTPFNTIAKQQTEPINLEKIKESKTTTSSGNFATTNYIETVVIDHICDEEEPIKKRIRSSIKSHKSLEAKIDKDPDPLTQLKLLIQNSQWKVPDPILVPKDRLGAVLASPAREIPLLLTTRPELKLPEAFAYPEILQNPNILVISMAQLEAILRNDTQAQKSDEEENVALQTQNGQILDGQNSFSSYNETKTSKAECKNNAKCIEVESSFDSNINAATLAVMNQMLWLPYLNQFSQDRVENLEIDASTDQSKVRNTSLQSYYNQSFGGDPSNKRLNNLSRQAIEFDKGVSEQKTNTFNHSNRFHTFPTPVEISIWEKLAQAHIHRLLSLNPHSSLNTDSAKPSFIEKCSSSQQKNLESNGLKNLNSIKKPIVDNNDVSSNMTKNMQYGISNKITGIEKANNAIHNYALNKNKSHTNTENKPRLTCKSLSNLLDPENVTPLTVPLANLVSENCKCATNLKHEQSCCSSPSNQANMKCSNSFNQRNLNCAKTTAPEGSIKNLETIITGSNPALWHPLFGSNNKQSYSSPWQWTTVTASGE